MSPVKEKKAVNPPKRGGTVLRLLLALLVGILWGLSLSTLYTQGMLRYDLVGVIFIPPLIMGIAAPFIVDWQGRHILLRSLLIGLVAWLGMSGFELVWADQQEAAYAASCQLPNALFSECVRGEGWLTNYTILYLGNALILIVLGAVIVCVIVMLVRKNWTRKDISESRRSEKV
jgi:uncharacterized membrane protein YraQ (UPF0718 family)